MTEPAPLPAREALQGMATLRYEQDAQGIGDS